MSKKITENNVFDGDSNLKPQKSIDPAILKFRESLKLPDLYPEALEFFFANRGKRINAQMLQEKFNISFKRAVHITDWLIDRGFMSLDLVLHSDYQFEKEDFLIFFCIDIPDKPLYEIDDCFENTDEDETDDEIEDDGDDDSVDSDDDIDYDLSWSDFHLKFRRWKVISFMRNPVGYEESIFDDERDYAVYVFGTQFCDEVGLKQNPCFEKLCATLGKSNEELLKTMEELPAFICEGQTEEDAGNIIDILIECKLLAVVVETDGEGNIFENIYKRRDAFEGVCLDMIECIVSMNNNITRTECVETLELVLDSVKDKSHPILRNLVIRVRNEFKVATDEEFEELKRQIN